MEIDKIKNGAENLLRGALHDFVYQKPRILKKPPNLDWRRLDALIFHYNLMPVFHYLYSASPIDPERIQRWYRVRLNVLQKNMRILKTTADLFSLFEQHNIPAVALRGLHLAHFLYPDPGLRPMRDVDILLNPRDRFKLQELLATCGYSADRLLRSQLVYTIDQTVFEFHWSFLTIKRYRSAIDTDWMIQSRIVQKTDQGLIYCLPNEQELIGVAAHAFIHHDLDGLMPLIDLGLLMADPDLDWNLIVAWCCEKRLTNLLFFVLSFANHFLKLNREAQLNTFNRSLPVDIADAFKAYAAAIWGRHSLRSRFLTIKTLFYVAEHPFTKIRQALRLIQPQEFRRFYRLLTRGQLLRRGGMQLNAGYHASDTFRSISNL